MSVHNKRLFIFCVFCVNNNKVKIFLIVFIYVLIFYAENKTKILQSNFSQTNVIKESFLKTIILKLFLKSTDALCCCFCLSVTHTNIHALGLLQLRYYSAHRSK